MERSWWREKLLKSSMCVHGRLWAAVAEPRGEPCLPLRTPTSVGTEHTRGKENPTAMGRVPHKCSSLEQSSKASQVSK